jgi:hypothetical protein
MNNGTIAALAAAAVGVIASGVLAYSKLASKKANVYTLEVAMNTLSIAYPDKNSWVLDGEGQEVSTWTDPHCMDHLLVGETHVATFENVEVTRYANGMLCVMVSNANDEPIRLVTHECLSGEIAKIVNYYSRFVQIDHRVEPEVVARATMTTFNGSALPF